MSLTRVILDTNVWSYIGQRAETAAFDQLERDRGIEVVLAPSLLLEICSDRDAERRRSGVEAMTSRSRTTLRSEAQSSVEEIVEATRELRPDWLRSMPKLEVVRQHEDYWRRTIWRQARFDPGLIHDAIQRVDQGEADQLLRQQQFNKDQLVLNETPIPMPHSLVGGFGPDAPDRETAGWRGDQVELWRLETAYLYRHQVLGRAVRTNHEPAGSTLAEWADAWLKLDAIRRDVGSFNEFWYYEVDVTAFPRNWLSWALYWIQLRSKLLRSNGADVQHAAYLVDADLFLSADRRFIRGLSELRESSPVRFAEPRLIPGEGSIVEAIESALE